MKKVITKKWYATSWFLVLFNIALFWFLAEIVLRIGGYYQNYGEANGGAFIDFSHSYYLGPLAAWPPNKTHILQTNEFTYELVCNSLGLRDVEHILEKPKGVKRILVLGDSFTEGMGAPFDSAWHQRMLYYFNQDSTLGNWEIINGAASGGDPFYGYEMLRRVGLQYEPDLVIQAFNSTDVQDYLARGGMERFVNDSLTVWRQPNKFLHLAYKYSHVVRYVVKEHLKYNDFYQSPEEQAYLKQQAAPAYQQLALKLDSLCTANGAAVLFVFHPHDYECKDGRYDTTTASIMSKIDATGLLNVDLMKELPKEVMDNTQDYYWPIDNHMNSRGYDVWGQIMYRYLKAQGFIQLDRKNDAPATLLP